MCVRVYIYIYIYIYNVESVAIILTEDVNGFKSTVRVTSFTCFDREKGL